MSNLVALLAFVIVSMAAAYFVVAGETLAALFCMLGVIGLATVILVMED